MAAERRDPRIDRISGRAVAIGLLAGLGASVLALVTRDLGPGSAVAIFMLAVAVSAVSGGIWAGVITALLAAVVFLAIAVVIGLVVGNAAAERRRATEREREARLLAFLSTKMLSGDVPDRVLDEFVGVLMEPFGLASCSVQVTLDGHVMDATTRAEGATPGGPTEIVPVVIAS